MTFITRAPHDPHVGRTVDSEPIDAMDELAETGAFLGWVLCVLVLALGIAIGGAAVRWWPGGHP